MEPSIVQSIIQVIPSVLTSLEKFISTMQLQDSQRKHIEVFTEQLKSNEIALNELRDAIINYAECHVALRDWKTLHDALTRINEDFGALQTAIETGRITAFSRAWTRIQMKISELRLVALPNLPPRWQFVTPNGSIAYDWRHELELHSLRLSSAISTLGAAEPQFHALKYLVETLILRASSNLIELAGNLADISSALIGRLSASNEQER
jgi:hypothetical protein